MTKISRIVECPYCGTFLDFKYEIMKVEEKNINQETVGHAENVIIFKIWHNKTCPGCQREMRSIGVYLS